MTSKPAYFAYPPSLRRLLARGDWLVASRFHAMIAGLALGIPTLVLGWGHKYREVLAEFDLEDNAYDYGDLEQESLTRRIESFIEAGDEVRDRIQRNLPRVCKASSDQLDWLVDFLGATANACTDDVVEEAP